MSKLKVIKKNLIQPCWKCEGTGMMSVTPLRLIGKCKVCNGTGNYKENHYIYLTGKYAIDGDTLK